MSRVGIFIHDISRADYDRLGIPESRAGGRHGNPPTRWKQIDTETTQVMFFNPRNFDLPTRKEEP